MATLPFHKTAGKSSDTAGFINLFLKIQASGENQLVSRHRDYDGLVYAENWQVLRRDEQLDAASHAGLLLDQSDLIEGL
jgi:hypothetical protein